MSESNEQALADIRAVRKRLAPYYDDDETEDWLTSPHPQLEGQTALSVILKGEAQQVLQIIDRLDSATYL